MTNRLVTEVSVSSATAHDPLTAPRQAVSPELPKRNLVKLLSIDADALGEEIEVIWELEPGAHVIKRAGLPSLSKLGDPADLEALLDATAPHPRPVFRGHRPNERAPYTDFTPTTNERHTTIVELFANDRRPSTHRSTINVGENE